jgi:hypothetical protein
MNNKEKLAPALNLEKLIRLPGTNQARLGSFYDASLYKFLHPNANATLPQLSFQTVQEVVFSNRRYTKNIPLDIPPPRTSFRIFLQHNATPCQGINLVPALQLVNCL